MSNAALIGFMDGLKDGESEGSFGNVEDTIKGINVTT
jgi:hypothetical protein